MLAVRQMPGSRAVGGDVEQATTDFGVPVAALGAAERRYA
jgi:hypothetical protein